MKITITNARRAFTDLLRSAENGEVVQLTRHGRAIIEVRAVSRPPQTEDERLIQAVGDLIAPAYLDGFLKGQNPKYLKGK